jgi:hypothetical protein
MLDLLEIAAQLRQLLFAQRGNLLALPGPGLRELIILLLDALLQDFFRLLQIRLLRDAPGEEREQSNNEYRHSPPRMFLRLKFHANPQPMQAEKAGSLP